MTHVMLIEDTAYAGERNVRLHVSIDSRVCRTLGALGLVSGHTLWDLNIMLRNNNTCIFALHPLFLSHYLQVWRDPVLSMMKY